ncbi:MAG: hypothetical protein CMJ31_09855, partial [Phycisphaerae bacterium]|nr:hypothetical protein [Phycisphaerae bacterium]
MTPGNTSRNGFTLVEVLLAVLVLGIGLLGLAAVFPVVIAQQRQSSETIAATGVAASVEAMLFDGDGAPGLRAILRDPGFGRLAAINNGEPVASYNAVGAPTGSPQPSDANDAWVASGSLLWETTFTWQSTGFGAHNRLIGSFPNLMGVNRLADAVREVGLVQIGTGPYLEWDADNADFTIDNGGGARIPGAWQPTTNNDANVHPGVTTLPVDAR